MTTTTTTERTALVTGASRGIGRAIAVRLAREGMLVAVNYSTQADAAHAVVAEIEDADGLAFAVQATLGSTDATLDLLAAFEKEMARRGRPPTLDVLVNNVGGSPFRNLSETSPEQFDQAWTLNARAPFLLTTAALPRINDGGRIINISSAASKQPIPQIGAYAMAKAALDAMTVALAVEMGPRRITVNAVAPGWTATDANAAVRENPELVAEVERDTALGRFGDPDDIAGVVAFLASADAGWITGQYVRATGGYRLI